MKLQKKPLMVGYEKPEPCKHLGMEACFRKDAAAVEIAEMSGGAA